MKEKNGFTLIELLAIIVILAIIAVITVPVILNVIENSRKGAAVDSAYGYKEAIYKGFLTELSSDPTKKLPDEIYVLDDTGKLIDKYGNVLISNVSGNIPQENSWVKLIKGEIVAYSLKFDDYVVTKYEDTEVVASKGNIADNPEVREAKLEAERIKNAKSKALQKVNTMTISQAGASEIQDITESEEIIGWVAFIEGTLKQYSIKISEGGYIYIVSDTDIDSTNSKQTADRTKTELDTKPNFVKVGDEKCFGPTESQECFKVISTNPSTTLLLANYNLKKDATTNPVTYKQDANSPDNIKFSESNYWISNGALVSTYSNNGAYSYDSTSGMFVDTNNNEAYPDVYSSNSNAYVYVEGYLTVLKTEIYGLSSTTTGRLLTYEEANNTTIFVNSNSRKNGEWYWLGTAHSYGGVKYVSNTGSFTGDEYSYGRKRGIRPVIIVPTTDIQ